MVSPVVPFFLIAVMGVLPGGWTEIRPINPDMKEIWAKTLQETEEYKSPQGRIIHLGAFGEPVSYRSQVVAGVKVEFHFTNGKNEFQENCPLWGAKVQVWAQA